MCLLCFYFLSIFFFFNTCQFESFIIFEFLFFVFFFQSDNDPLWAPPPDRDSEDGHDLHYGQDGQDRQDGHDGRRNLDEEDLRMDMDMDMDMDGIEPLYADDDGYDDLVEGVEFPGLDGRLGGFQQHWPQGMM